MKDILRGAAHKLAGAIASRVDLTAPQASITWDAESIHQQLQLTIRNQWIQFRTSEIQPYSRIREAGFRCYSQFEEDGIILYLLTMIGADAGSVVEMCCGPGDECMATNLILNHGYTGFLFDGSHDNIMAADAFFSSRKDCLLIKPSLKSTWITAENVNDLLEESGCPCDVDFFSLDIDGNDYWIWKAIERIRPKICCFETADFIPSGLSLTIPYRPDFCCWTEPLERQDFRSVSLSAMTKLSAEKGYRLVGAHRHGFNVFFMRNDLGTALFPEIDPAEVHENTWSRLGQLNRWDAVKNLGWVEV
jgi:hypothetical protein